MDGGRRLSGRLSREGEARLPSRPEQAVGRTSSIAGGATFTGPNGALVISTASFTIDLSTLKSDRSMRDEKIRTIGLESNTYPHATFVLSKPIVLPTSAAKGVVVNVPATGVLTIHGVARNVSIPVATHLSPSLVEVVGSITFPWSKFDMTAPSVGGFVNVTNSATMEFQLHLRRP